MVQQTFLNKRFLNETEKTVFFSGGGMAKNKNPHYGGKWSERKERAIDWRKPISIRLSQLGEKRRQSWAKIEKCQKVLSPIHDYLTSRNSYRNILCTIRLKLRFGIELCIYFFHKHYSGFFFLAIPPKQFFFLTRRSEIAC